MISTISRLKRARCAARLHDNTTEQVSVVSFDTDLGWMAVAYRDDALVGLVFGHPSQRQAKLALARSLRQASETGPFIDVEPSNELPAWAEKLVDDLCRFAAGEPVDFTGVPLHLDHLTAFGRSVVAKCRRLGWGHVSTYGALAAASGKPGAARAVGSVMAKNRYPLIVPCHRVLGAGGALGGYSAPDGLRMKRRLLEMEGACARPRC